MLHLVAFFKTIEENALRYGLDVADPDFADKFVGSVSALARNHVLMLGKNIGKVGVYSHLDAGYTDSMVGTRGVGGEIGESGGFTSVESPDVVRVSRLDKRRARRKKYRDNRKYRRAANSPEGDQSVAGSDSGVQMSAFELAKFDLYKERVTKQLEFERLRTEAYANSMAAGNARAEFRARDMRVRVSKSGSEVTGSVKDLDSLKKAYSDASLTPSQSVSQNGVRSGVTFSDVVKSAIGEGLAVHEIVSEFRAAVDACGKKVPVDSKLSSASVVSKNSKSSVAPGWGSMITTPKVDGGKSKANRGVKRVSGRVAEKIAEQNYHEAMARALDGDNNDLESD